MSAQTEHERARQAYAKGKDQREGAAEADRLTRAHGAAAAQAGGAR